MKREMGDKNRARLVRMGIVISQERKMRGFTREQLAQRAHVSRSLIDSIESPHAHAFSVDVLLRIADALNVDAACLMRAAEELCQRADL